MHFKPRGICATDIEFDIRDGRVYDVKFTNGCDGNHKGITALIEGMEVEEAVKRLSGITCGPRKTSCPDQLAEALNFRDLFTL